MDGIKKCQFIVLMITLFFKRYRESEYNNLMGNKELVDFLPKVREIIKMGCPVSSKDIDFDELVSW